MCFHWLRDIICWNNGAPLMVGWWVKEVSWHEAIPYISYRPRETQQCLRSSNLPFKGILWPLAHLWWSYACEGSDWVIRIDHRTWTSPTLSSHVLLIRDDDCYLISFILVRLLLFYFGHSILFKAICIYINISNRIYIFLIYCFIKHCCPEVLWAFHSCACKGA